MSSVSRTRFSVKVQCNPSQLQQQSASTAQQQVGVLKPFLVASQKPNFFLQNMCVFLPPGRIKSDLGREVVFTGCCNILLLMQLILI